MKQIIFFFLLFVVSLLSAQKEPFHDKLQFSFYILEENFSLNNRTIEDLNQNESLLPLADSAVSYTLEHFPEDINYQISAIRTLIVEGNYYLRTERFNQSLQKLLLAKELCEKGNPSLENEAPLEICERLRNRHLSLPSLYSLVIHHLGQIPLYDKHTVLTMDDAEKYLRLATDIRIIIDASNGGYANISDNNQEVGDYVIFLRTLGYVYLQTDKLDKALDIYLELDKVKDPFNQLMTHRQLLQIYQQQAQAEKQSSLKKNLYQLAMQSAAVCLEKIDAQIGNYTRVSSVYRDIARLYADLENPYKDYTESYRLLELSKKFCHDHLRSTECSVRVELTSLLQLLAASEMQEAARLNKETIMSESVDSLKYLENIQSHLNSYESLGDIYQKEGNPIIASGYYSNGLSLAQKNPDQTQDVSYFYKKLFDVESEYLINSESHCYEAFYCSMQKYQLALTNLRKQTDKDCARNIPVRTIYESITKKYQEICQIVIEDLFEILGPPPSENFAFISFGSLGRGIPTPYSDLEFGILLADGVDHHYFEKLSTLFHIRVNALAESPIFYFELKELQWMDVNNCPSKRGFLMDPWNVVPHAQLTDSYKLLGTPREVAIVFSSDFTELPSWKKSTFYTHGHLYGNPDLIKKYENEVDNILQDENRKQLLEEMKGHDAKKYCHHIGQWLNNPDSFSLKRDFYRPLMNQLDAISIRKKMHSVTPWDVVDRLKTDGDIDNNLHKKIVEGINKLVLVRLKAYSTYHSQNHTVYTVDKTDSKDENKFIEKKELLQEILEVLISLQKNDTA